MSYSLIAKFADVKNKQVLAVADVSFLKYVGGNKSYSSTFDDIDPDECPDKEFEEQISSYISIDFYNYISKENFEILKQNIQLGDLAPYDASNRGYKGQAFICDKNLLEINEDLFLENVTLELIQSEDFKNDYIWVYSSEIKHDSGHWYSFESFEKYRTEAKKKLDESVTELSRLNALKLSKDYYEMSDSAKDSLLTDIGYAEEAVEEYQNEYDKVTLMCDILSFYQNDFAVKNKSLESPNDCDFRNYSWYDDRCIKVFINAD